MKKLHFPLFLLPTIFLFILFLLASAQAETQGDFCQARGAREFGQQHLRGYGNLLAFRNQGGIGGGGVCWWHSRFTRNAAFLARFRPTETRPDAAGARRIIRAIRAGQGIVNVPGYTNLHDFSRDFESEIQGTLNHWQRSEGVGGAWIRGLRGASNVTASSMERAMHALYDLVEVQKQVVYQKLQMPGIVAHAWLVIGMRPTSNGYSLTVIDSNYFGPTTHTYRKGMTNMPYGGGNHFVPYTEYQAEGQRLRDIVSRHCQGVRNAIASN